MLIGKQRHFALLDSFRDISSFLSSFPSMEKFGEQCTVVFALIVTEPATECECEWGIRNN
jgi:hypothetical protein